MPSYRPPISRDQYHYLEIYFFRLAMFTNSIEYKNLSSRNKNKVDYEICYISMALDILQQVFRDKGLNERPVVAYKEKSEPGEYQIVYRFSCIKVAAGALDCNPSKIAQVCKGERKTTGGVWKLNEETGKKEWFDAYIFEYEEDYDMNQPKNFDPNSSEFKFI